MKHWKCALTSSFLVVAIAASAWAQVSDRNTAWQTARALAESKHYDEALQVISSHAADNSDLDAQVFAARLHSWKGDFTIAERIYRDVLRVNDHHIDARLGLVDVLSWVHRYSEALRELRVVQTSLAQSTEILARKARIEWWSGDTRKARLDFEALLKIKPGDPEAAYALKMIACQASYQLDLGASAETDASTGQAGSASMLLTYRGLKHWDLTTGLIPERRFGHTGVHYLAQTAAHIGRTVITTQGSWLFGNTPFLNRSDLSAELVQRLGRISLGGGYRRLTFRDARVQIPTAIADWQATPSLELEGRFTPALTTTNSAQSWRQGGVIRLTWTATSTLAPFVSFGLGSVSSGVIENGRIDYFAAQTYTTGIRVRLSPSQSFEGFYSRENRNQNIVAHGFGTSYRVMF